MQRTRKNKYNIDKFISTNMTRLGSYAPTYKEIMTHCYDQNKSYQLLKWFSDVIIKYKLGTPLNLQKDNNYFDDYADQRAFFPQVLDTPSDVQESLKKVAVIKLNGGLGTSLGSTIPKSLIKLTPQKRLIDFICEQHRALNEMYSLTIPLIMMNSFYTKNFMSLEPHLSNEITFFEQHKIPRLLENTLAPLALNKDDSWAPPGHGNIFLSLYESGLLESLMHQGIEFIFISNSDNLGATLDPAIASYIRSENLDFMMEVTPKKAVDKKGGSVVFDGKSYKLLEHDQSSAKMHHDNQQPSFFNTNNIWVRLSAIKQIIENDELHLPVIINKKQIKNQAIIQFETAMGSAIECFQKTRCIQVDRNRFFPIKHSSDLLLLQSSLVSFEKNGNLRWKNLETLPIINLNEHYKTIQQCQELISVIPDITNLSSLTIIGPVIFNQKITLTGDVVIRNNASVAKPLLLKEISNQEVMV